MKLVDVAATHADYQFNICHYVHRIILLYMRDLIAIIIIITILSLLQEEEEEEDEDEAEE